MLAREEEKVCYTGICPYENYLGEPKGKCPRPCWWDTFGKEEAEREEEEERQREKMRKELEEELFENEKN